MAQPRTRFRRRLSANLARPRAGATVGGRAAGTQLRRGAPSSGGGSRIVPVPGFPGERAAQSILDEIAYYTRRYGLRLTDAYGPNHSSPGHTRYGTAADFAGPDKQMDKAAAALAAAGYKVLYDGRFGTTRWPGHGPSSVAGTNAHIHVEFGNRSGRAPDPGGDVEAGADVVAGGLPGPQDAANALVGGLVAALGEAGVRMLLYLALAGGAIVLAAAGIARLANSSGTGGQLLEALDPKGTR